MNPLDWLLALIILYSIIRAAVRGLVREAFALVGLIVGFLLACWNYQAAAVYLRGLINSPPLAEFCAFLLIVAIVMVLASLLGRLVQRTASAVGLSLLDRLGGAAFGLLRGAILGIALLLAVTAFLPASPWIKNSRIAPYLLRAAHAVSFVMPRELKLQLHAGLDHLQGIAQLKHTTALWINHGFSSHTRI
ncbi:MAG TPA: CvpA family protein [Acidobacteriaceae bacterium]|jgi:membrane protein required for colicin V production|nr:CvpA family protein [Acidobacteriaceae bacterium]